jgi:hypothetical protein
MVIYADAIALGANMIEELQQAVEMWQPVPRLEITVDGHWTATATNSSLQVPRKLATREWRF